MSTEKNHISLSEEQQLFISKALEGHNILVDACIGSGKRPPYRCFATQCLPSAIFSTLHTTGC